MSTTPYSIRVLHVDDEPDFAKLAANHLERQDERLDVDVASTASEAADRLERTEYDCVVSDFDMPDRNGIEFLEGVREHFADLPFILYTGKGSEEVASDAISAGVTDYLQKETGTSQYEVLANRIINAVEQRRARRLASDTEERLRTIAEHSTDILWKFDADWSELQFINSSYEEIWGRSVDELKNEPQSFLEGVHPEDRSFVIEAMEQLSNGEPVDIEYRVNAGEDFSRWVWVQAKPVYDDCDEVESVVGFARDITVRKTRERTHLQLQDLLERALAATNTYVWDWDIRSGDIKRYPSVQSMFGMSSADIGSVHGGWIERVHPEDRPYVEQTIVEGVETGDGYQFECRFETEDGTYRWVRDRGEVEMVDGEPVRAIGSVTDVTPQKEREQTLVELVQQFGELIDTSTTEETCQVAIDIADEVLGAPLVGVHLLSEDGERLEAVAALDKVREEFGVPPVYERDAEDAISELIWRTFESGRPTYLADTRANGISSDITPARSGIVNPLGEHGVLVMSTTEPEAFDEADRALSELLAQAITAVLGRVERELMLVENNRRLERLHEAGQELIQADSKDEIADRIVDCAKSILDYPLAMVRYYDESAGGLVPTAATEQVWQIFESRPTFTAEDGSLSWAVYESGSPAIHDDLRTIEYAVDFDTPIRSLMILPMGEFGTVSIGSTSPKSFDESDVSLVQLLVTTAALALTNLEREQELIQQRDALHRQNERLDEFASVVSHDLRNPLNVVEGRIELAMDATENENLESALEALERMETLIDDMLSLARSGETVGETEPVELSALVESCWRNVETVSARLEVETDLTIEADKTRLQQLLENLLRNAVEHGGEDGTITVGELTGGFYVEDDGPGIPEDEREAVLEPGYATSEHGTGFGLSIVRDIAEAHEWDFTINVGSEGGARFEFIICSPGR